MVDEDGGNAGDDGDNDHNEDRMMIRLKMIMSKISPTYP